MGQNRTDFEVKQRIDALPPVVRAQMTEILLEMLNGSSQRAMAASAFTGPLTGNVAGALAGTHTGNAILDATVFTPTVVTATGALPATSFIQLNHATVKIEASTTPTAGQLLIVTQKDAGTAAHTLTTAGTFDGTNNTATFDAANETLVLFAISSTRWVILNNTGSVGLSAV